MTVPSKQISASHQKNSGNFLRPVITVGLWTLCSRIFGLFREIAIAAYLGAGPIAEAFVVAFTLPNMFRRFFAEGAFNMAFVPMYTKKLSGSKKNNADDFAINALNGLLLVLVILTVIAELAMPFFVLAMASGFYGDERFDLAVLYGRIAFPYLILISVVALCSGMLNAMKRFLAASIIPVLLSVILIIALFIADELSWPVGIALVLAVLIAGVLQLMVVALAVRRAGFRFRLRMPVLTDDLRALLKTAAPVAFAGGVVQINLLVGRQIASQSEGAIQYLNLADRLYQLPLGVVAIAAGIVLLPELSRKLAKSDTKGGQRAFNQASELVLLLTFPAMVALLVIPLPIVSVLYEHGAFNAKDAYATAQATVLYALGLPAFVLQKTFQPLFFARADTMRPFHYAVVSMALNVVVAVALFPIMGFLSAAIATTIAAWCMLGLLWWGAQKVEGCALLNTRFKRQAWRQIVASIVMGVALYALAFVLSSWLEQPFARYPVIFVLIVSGIAVYVGVALYLGVIDKSMIHAFKKKQ